MTKLLYITNGVKHPGGLESVLCKKTYSLVNDFDYNISIITLNDTGRESFYSFHEDIDFFDVSFKGNMFKKIFSYINGIRKIIHSIQPDIIIVCDDALKGFFLPLITGRKIPIVYERHTSTEILKYSGRLRYILTKRLMQFLSKKFDKFIVLTPSHLDDWPSGNVSVIPNCIPFKMETLSNLYSQQVIAVGKICENKGYARMVNIWSKINQKFPSWELHIYGKESDGGALREKISNSKPPIGIKLFSPVRNIQDKYLQSSIIIMTSHYEGLPMVLIEAMSCGLPAIAYDCPYGPRDIIDNAKNGFLIPDDNADEFIDKLSILIENTDLRREFGGNAVNTSLRYSKENIIREWHLLFKSLLDNK